MNRIIKLNNIINVDKAFISLLEAILQQVKWQLSMKEKELYD